MPLHMLLKGLNIKRSDQQFVAFYYRVRIRVLFPGHREAYMEE